MNITIAKYNSQRSKLLNRPKKTSNPFKSEAETDYDIKKKKEKDKIMGEIVRVSETSRY